MPEWSNIVKNFAPLDFIDYTLRGCGQVRSIERMLVLHMCELTLYGKVYFMNNPITGIILLVGLVIEKPLLAVGCLIG